MNRSALNNRALLLSAALLMSSTGARSAIVNGDFEGGSTGWTADQPDRWTVDFPAAGGNPGGFGHIQSPFGDSGGQGCISQEFDCGDGQVCTISFDYRLDNLDASPLSARVVVYVDSLPLFTSPAADHIDWNTITVTVPCGTHLLGLCLQVDAGNNGWEAGFDNVAANCSGPIPVDPYTWGRIKSRYR